MNISKIRSMALQGDLSLQGLRYLVNCRGECEHLDFKQTINLDFDHDCLSICRDILGMKNVGGGFIIIGVEDRTWLPVGIKHSLGLDTKALRDKVRKYCGLDLEVYIVEHQIMLNGDIKLFAMILIKPPFNQNKLKRPSICKISCLEKEKWGIRQGDIYIRDGDQTIRLDDLSKLQDILDGLEYKYQEADQIEASTIPSPFEVENGLYRLLPREYETFVGRQGLLSQIKNAIEKDPRLWIINIFGPGGVGKSALATCIAYDYFHEGKFEAILHLSAKDRELSSGCGIRSLRPSLISVEDLIDRILILFSHQEYCEKELTIKKDIVHELLSAWSTLIILDNMETVTDGRIMDFVREFPPSTKAKVLLTSRQRTYQWEVPISVPEFNEDEIQEFIKRKSKDLSIDFPYNNKDVINKIAQISGGLPLAIQWILGDYSRTNDLEAILKRVLSSESPLLEFSFRNSWKTLDEDAQQALAILSLFDEAPTLQEWRTILNWTIERIDHAKEKLIEATFVTERTDQKTGSKKYIALPITLSFAKNELTKMGEIGILAKSRYEVYKQRLSLAQEEVDQYEDLFLRFEVRNDNQKKAILLARMAEGQVTSLGYQEAEEYYKQALDLDPLSVYALVSYGKFKSDLFDNEKAIELISKSIPKVTKNTGFFVYYNLADVYGKKRDSNLKIKYLKEALSYEENHLSNRYTMAQHSLGVALGKIGAHNEAIKNFDEIIDRELSKPHGPNKSLVIAARTKKISITRTKPSQCNEFLNELISKCKTLGYFYILDDLQYIRDHE